MIKKTFQKGCFVILGLGVLCVSVYFLIFGQDIIAIIHTTDQYMQAVSNRDAETAYNLLANRSKKISSVALYEQAFLNNQFYSPYLGYEKMCFTWIQFEPSRTHESVADPPYGRTANLFSCVRYKDPSKKGSMTVYLEKEEDGNWRIMGIMIIYSKKTK